MIADLAMSGLSRVPVLLGVALISLAYSTCGTLALCLAGFFYFIKVNVLLIIAPSPDCDLLR